MDFSLFLNALGFIAILFSIRLNIQAYAKLPPEQQRSIKAAQAPRLLFVIPLLVSFWLTSTSVGKQASIGWLHALVWTVSLLITVAWEHRRLRARELPSGYLKSHLIMEALFIGGAALIFLIL